jgi:hypothetical protein
MPASEITVQLSPRELLYLKNTDFLPVSLSDIINAAQSLGSDRHTVQISRDVAEQFRSAFTERLAKAGFDADYEPTSEGELLEQLIDRFYRGQ